jgi:putative endonuclease
MSRRADARRRAWRYGRWAEAACVACLILRGYRVLARRFRTPVGELDIVARRGRVLAVIEVKARAEMEAASQALTARQRRRIARAAEAFLQARPRLAGLAVRFDVMLVEPWRLPRHLPAAFEAEA